HDRYLLDRVSTDLLALDGKGNARIYAELSQWEAAIQTPEPAVKKPVEKPRPNEKSSPPARKKLTWNEQRELESIEGSIHAAEALVLSWQKKTTDSTVIADHVKLHEAYDQLSKAQQEVERLYARWAELEEKK